jgi:hypothetical protein
MKTHFGFNIKINDDEQPRYNEYITDEWTLKENAKQVLLAQLVRGADEYRANATIHQFEELIRSMEMSIKRTSKPSIESEVETDALEIIENYDMIDDFITALIDTGEASTDLYNDYTYLDYAIAEADDYWRNPTEAIEVIDELSEYEEEDSGLWEGSSNYSDILNAIAHYTYTNALYAKIVEKIEEINDEINMDDIREQATEKILDEDDDAIMEEAGIDLANIDEITEWCEENYQEDYQEAMEAILKEAIKEFLK